MLKKWSQFKPEDRLLERQQELVLQVKPKACQLENSLCSGEVSTLYYRLSIGCMRPTHIWRAICFNLI